MNIGVFGGSFDPIHYGHLLLAEQCIESANLDKVLLIPAAQSPLKSHSPIANNRSRLEMLQLAVADHPQLEISTLELDRGDVSYTVDTLKQLRERFPEDQLFLMIGADSLVDFARWKSPEEIVKLATLLIIARPEKGEAGEHHIPWEQFQSFASADQIEQWRNQLTTTDAFDFSSTDLRQRAGEGRSLRYRTPRSVEMYIQTQNTYSAAKT